MEMHYPHKRMDWEVEIYSWSISVYLSNVYTIFIQFNEKLSKPNVCGAIFFLFERKSWTGSLPQVNSKR